MELQRGQERWLDVRALVGEDVWNWMVDEPDAEMLANVLPSSALQKAIFLDLQDVILFNEEDNAVPKESDPRSSSGTSADNQSGASSSVLSAQEREKVIEMTRIYSSVPSDEHPVSTTRLYLPERTMGFYTVGVAFGPGGGVLSRLLKLESVQVVPSFSRFIVDHRNALYFELFKLPNGMFMWNRVVFLRDGSVYTSSFMLSSPDLMETGRSIVANVVALHSMSDCQFCRLKGSLFCECSLSMRMRKSQITVPSASYSDFVALFIKYFRAVSAFMIQRFTPQHECLSSVAHPVVRTCVEYGTPSGSRSGIAQTKLDFAKRLFVLCIQRHEPSVLFRRERRLFIQDSACKQAKWLQIQEESSGRDHDELCSLPSLFAEHEDEPPACDQVAPKRRRDSEDIEASSGWDHAMLLTEKSGKRQRRDDIESARVHRNSDAERARVFPCTACDMKFLCRAHLNSHLKSVHLRVRDYVCEACSAAFTSRGNLNRHMDMKHNDVKRFACEACGSSFVTNDKLKRHMQSRQHQLAVARHGPDDA
ncbi:Telomere zinc finger-associated protein [Porphyridium purpureum]|uniref:Telomere zinc finger-associated protein n=1 Tax=Porphyridium purpureum TaxID=35688 RepID=A0A5J4Z7E9_PORPP|nr:Telomere zinc finger-associated protein [Porphyridium purpureum]|eukprot:POR3371..scf295_1